MSDLIMRAEQGILGALLAGHEQTALTENLTADDFGHPTHQAIYRALHDLQALDYDTPQLAAAVADLVNQAGVDRQWLRALAAEAPDTDRVRAYTQIVVQAAFDREIAGFAEPYHAAARQATDLATRDSLTRLGQAIDAQAAVFAPASTIDADHRIEAATALRLIETDVPLHREDQVIADVIQHPEQARNVAAWLDSAVFTTGQRRLAFEVAVSIAYDHDPLDSVILAWHVERARDISTLYQHQAQLPDPREETDYAYLTRLEATRVTAGTAVVVGRELLTEHVQATLAHSVDAAAERAVTAALAHTAARTRQIAAEPPMPTASTADIRPIEL